MTDGAASFQGDVPTLDEPTVARGRTGPERKVIGRPSLGLLIFVWAAIVMTFAFAWSVLAGPANDPSNIVPIGLLLGAMVSVWYLIGTSRVVVRRASVDLVSLVLVYRVPFEQIRGWSVDSGFRLVLVSGRSVGTMALGDSLIGQITGHRRARRVASRLQALTGIQDSGEARDWKQDSVTATLRLDAIAQAVALIVCYLSVARSSSTLRADDPGSSGPSSPKGPLWATPRGSFRGSNRIRNES